MDEELLRGARNRKQKVERRRASTNPRVAGRVAPFLKGRGGWCYAPWMAFGEPTPESQA